MDKKRFNEKLKKEYRSKETEPARAHHSYAYHKYFEGYEEKRVKNEKGKIVIQRRYVGSYFERNISSKANIIYKVLYWLFLIDSILVFSFSATRNITANKTWYLAVLQLVAILMFIWNLKGIFNATIAKKKMTIGDYKSSSLSLKISTFATMIALSLNALFTIFYFIFDHSDVFNYIIAILGYLFSALIIFIINRFEYKLKYNEIPFEGEKDEEASEIEA